MLGWGVQLQRLDPKIKSLRGLTMDQLDRVKDSIEDVVYR
jgi:hypothetical protein